MAEKLKLGESTAEMIRKINDVITEVNSDEDYSLPLAANGTRGGLQVGYTESGANIPVKLSSEKAYVTVSKTSVTSALTYAPAKDSDVVKLAGEQTITGNKTTTGTFAIQNGSASGAFVLGADVNAKTLTANQRKLGRMGVPSYDSTTKTVAGISFDSQVNANYADFGGHPNNASSIAPDVIRFVVANEHKNEVAGKRTLALQISKQDGLSDTAGGGTSVAGAKFFLPVSSTGDISAPTFTENGTKLESKYLGIKAKAQSAASADSVAWANVSGKPDTFYTLTKGDITTVLGYSPASSAGISTMFSQFHTDLTNGTVVVAKATSSASADSVAWENVSDKPTIPVFPTNWELTSNLYLGLDKTELLGTDGLIRIEDGVSVMTSSAMDIYADSFNLDTNTINLNSASEITISSTDSQINLNSIYGVYVNDVEIGQALQSLQSQVDGKLGVGDKASSATVADSANAVLWNNVTGKPSLVTLDTTQTITGAKTYTGNQTFKNNYFEVKANSNTDDSWIKMTNSTDAGYYAFGIRRPYANYGLQMKYHPADSSGDKYYKIWNEDNDGAGSGLDADKLDGQQGSYYTGYTDTAIAGLSSVYQPKGNYLGVSEKAQSAVVADSASAVHWDNVTNKPSSYYTLPTASSSTLGGVKTGSNITNTSGTISLSKSNVTTALGYTPVSKAGDTLSDGATLKFSTYGTRFITISGNSISADMSNETGGWSGTFASVKDPSGATTSMLGWFGGATGLTHIFMGGTYSDPFMKFTNDGQFTFKKTPKVGTASLALASEVSTALSTAKTYTDTAVSNLVNSAPDALNTLQELSKALGDDPNFATTVTNNLAGKLGKTEKAADSAKLNGQEASYYLNYNNLSNKPTIPSAYSLPLSANGTRGGIQIGYTASGANIPVQLSSEKAYVALTSTAVTSALGYTPASTSYYWANVGISSTSNDNTTPTFNPAFKVKLTNNLSLAPANDGSNAYASPIPKYLWHDLLGFGINGEPTVETSTNGTTWTETTDANLKKKLFINREDQTVTVIKDSQPYIRWTWYNTQFHACQASWVAIGFAYATPVATNTILMQTSNDGTTWTTVCEKSLAGNQAPYWFKINSGWSSQYYFRITFQRTSASGTLTNISGIKLLTARWGNQGRGSEYEYPYAWDENSNIYRRNTTQTLGTASQPWAGIYGTTLYEGGTSLANKYQAKGNYLTGITKEQVTNALGYTPPQQDTTYTVATTSKHGLMSYIDKQKLDGIPETLVEHVTVDGEAVVMSQDVDTIKALTYRYFNNEVVITVSLGGASANVTGVTYNGDNDIAWTVTAPTTSYSYDPGLVEIDETYMGVYVLHAHDGMVTLATGFYPLVKGIATTEEDGYMSASDKAKLDGLSNDPLPVATSSTLGGIKIGYSASGANVPVQLSSEKAYVALTKSAVTSALGYTPPTSSDISTAISNLVDSSPDALNTLNELAAALGDDPNFATTVTNNLAGKLDKSGGTTTGLITLPYDKSSLRFGAASAAQGYYWDTYYRSNGDEGLVFSGGNNKVSFVIRNDAKTSWNDSGAALHVKNNTVAINKTITGASASYTLDVGGTINGTTLYENGTSLADKYQAKGTYLSSLPTRLNNYSTSGYGDANDATEQGWHYMTSTATNRPPFKQVDIGTGSDSGSDYRIMSTSYGTTWLQQIATDFRSNDIFTRRKQNGKWQGWTALVKMQQGLTSPVGTNNAIARWDSGRNATIKDSNVTIDDNGVLNATTLQEGGTSLSDKYQAKGSYLTGITKSQVTTALGYTPPSSLSDLGITATATELNYVDGVSSNIQTQLNGKIPCKTMSSYNLDTVYDCGVYLVGSGSNVPSGSKFGSLLCMPYRKATGNTSPDYATQLFMPNGDDSTKPNSLFYRTSKGSAWNAWQEVATKSDIPTATATTTTNGLMSSEDKTKLDGVATGANNYKLYRHYLAIAITHNSQTLIGAVSFVDSRSTAHTLATMNTTYNAVPMYFTATNSSTHGFTGMLEFSSASQVKLTGLRYSSGTMSVLTTTTVNITQLLKASVQEV